MNTPQKIYRALERLVVARLTRLDLEAEMQRRDGRESIGDSVVPWYVGPRKEISLDDWKQAVDMAMSPHLIDRVGLYQVYWNVMNDLHLHAIIDKRIRRVAYAPWKLIDQDGNQDDGAAKLLRGLWFSQVVGYIMEALFYGHSLIELWEQSDRPIEVETNRGRATVRPLKRARLIRREHVKPELGVFVRNLFERPELGISYRDEVYSRYYMEVGEPDDYGLLLKICPPLLFKRWALAHWSDFGEKLGIPFRWITMKGTNKLRERRLGEIMAQMGSAGWAVAHDGEEIKLVESQRTDPHKVFLELLNYLDRSLSKAVLGQTLTTDDGQNGTLAQGLIHAGEGDLVAYADMQYAQYYLNRELLPRLVDAFGYPLDGYEIDLDEKKDLSIEEQVKVDTMLLMHYEIDPAYIAERYDIPLEYIQAAARSGDAQQVENLLQENGADPTDPNQTPGESRAQASAEKKKPLTGCGCSDDCDHTHRNLSQDMVQASAVLAQSDEDYLRRFFDDVSARGWDADYFLRTHRQLLEALGAGWDAGSVSLVYGAPDALTRALFMTDIHRFGWDKTAYQVAQLNQLIKQGLTWPQFRDQAGRLLRVLNENYLQAEYNTAQAIAQNTARLLEHQAEADLFPYWQYKTIGDERVRVSHQPLHNMVFRIDDPAGLAVYPPNGWNCRCSAVRLEDWEGDVSTIESARTALDADWDKLERAGFLVNRTQARVLFDDRMGYLRSLPEDQRAGYRLADLTWQAFGLPQGSTLMQGAAPIGPVLTREQIEQRWQAQQVDGRTVHPTAQDLQAYLDRPGLDSQAEPGLWAEAAATLRDPDEVYYLPVDDGHRLTYIKYFEGQALRVTLYLDDVTPPTITSWERTSNIDAARTGLLVVSRP